MILDTVNSSVLVVQVFLFKHAYILYFKLFNLHFVETAIKIGSQYLLHDDL